MRAVPANVIFTLCFYERLSLSQRPGVFRLHSDPTPGRDPWVKIVQLALAAPVQYSTLDCFSFSATVVHVFPTG